jgi:hypothetical protein
MRSSSFSSAATLAESFFTSVAIRSSFASFMALFSKIGLAQPSYAHGES